VFNRKRPGFSRCDGVFRLSSTCAAMTRKASGGKKRSVVTNIDDLRIPARKRVLRMVYDYADSEFWTEPAYRANERALM
jgi:hypothetical protein